MHPEMIRSFPSAEFYAESLEDGPHIEERTDFHGMTIVVSDPSVFLYTYLGSKNPEIHLW